MTKYLVLLAVVGLVIWWLRRGRAPDEERRMPPGKKHKDTSRSPAAPVPMLACAHCGVHLPQADAVTDADGRPFCGEAHRLAGAR